MSTVHVAFELNPSTNLVLLSVRSKRSSSVSFSILPSPDKKGSGDKNPSGEARGVQITGDGVITYAQNYRVTIASYEFNLVWRTFTLDSRSNRNSLEKFTIQEYEVSMRLTSQLRTRDRPTEIDTSEAQSWHITRLNTTRPNFQDVRELRKKIGIGSFGTVYSAYDQTSGYKFAIKVVHLDRYGNTDEARALLHREIKVMERLKHVSPLNSTHLFSY
jgi:hypothetical protein